MSSLAQMDKTSVPASLVSRLSCLVVGTETRLTVLMSWFTNSSQMLWFAKNKLQPACENTGLCKKIPDTWPSQTEIF